MPSVPATRTRTSTSRPGRNAHDGRQPRQPGGHVGAVAVPAGQHVHRVGAPQPVDDRAAPPGPGPEPGRGHQAGESLVDGVVGEAVPETNTVSPVRTRAALVSAPYAVTPCARWATGSGNASLNGWHAAADRTEYLRHPSMCRTSAPRRKPLSADAATTSPMVRSSGRGSPSGVAASRIFTRHEPPAYLSPTPPCLPGHSGHLPSSGDGRCPLSLERYCLAGPPCRICRYCAGRAPCRDCTGWGPPRGGADALPVTATAQSAAGERRGRERGDGIAADEPGLLVLAPGRSRGARGAGLGRATDVRENMILIWPVALMVRQKR